MTFPHQPLAPRTGTAGLNGLRSLETGSLLVVLGLVVLIIGRGAGAT